MSGCGSSPPQSCRAGGAPRSSRSTRPKWQRISAVRDALPSGASCGSHEQRETDLADDQRARHCARQKLAFRCVPCRRSQIMDNIRHNEDGRCRYSDARTCKQEGCNDWVHDGKAGPVSSAGPADPTIIPKQPVLEQDASMIEPREQQASRPDASDDAAPALHEAISRDLLLMSKPMSAFHHPVSCRPTITLAETGRKVEMNGRPLLGSAEFMLNGRLWVNQRSECERPNYDVDSSPTQRTCNRPAKYRRVRVARWPELHSTQRKFVGTFLGALPLTTPANLAVISRFLPRLWEGQRPPRSAVRCGRSPSPRAGSASPPPR